MYRDLEKCDSKAILNGPSCSHLHSSHAAHQKPKSRKIDRSNLESLGKGKRQIWVRIPDGSSQLFVALLQLYEVLRGCIQRTWELLEHVSYCFCGFSSLFSGTSDQLQPAILLSHPLKERLTELCYLSQRDLTMKLRSNEVHEWWREQVRVHLWTEQDSALTKDREHHLPTSWPQWLDISFYRLHAQAAAAVQLHRLGRTRKSLVRN